MKTVYQTLDGKTFGELADAEQHEAQVLAQVAMWNWDNERTTNTAYARLIHLTGDGAGRVFRSMQIANPEEYNPVSPEEIDDEDCGWFYWDEYAEKYRYLDQEVIDAIIHANHEI